MPSVVYALDRPFWFGELPPGLADVELTLLGIFAAVFLVLLGILWALPPAEEGDEGERIALLPLARDGGK
jgi:hypothetical protein